MHSDTLTRNTLFALLIAVEQDIRALFVSELHGQPCSLNESDMAKLRNRLPENLRILDDSHWLEFLDYFDLSATLEVLTHYSAPISVALAVEKPVIQKLGKHLAPLMNIRNRVCHARPLESDDLINTTEKVKSLIQGQFGVPFHETKNVFGKLNNKDYFLALSIPDYWKNDLEVIENNLPAPDFSDTGFVGRTTDIENLTKHILGHHPVITVTGEGGLGKTSLTLRCLQDVIHQISRFDFVIWTSLKTTYLTPSGIREATNALRNESELLSSIADQFGYDKDGSVDDLFAAVKEILSTCRVLLVIDNLETIDRSALRPLFVEIPAHSKILITSRIGIGEIEIRYPLEPMKAPEAVLLLRKTAHSLNVTNLSQRPNQELESLCEKLFFNPLAIRWFVQSYSEGRSIQDILDRHMGLEAVLSFCFENLYEKLSDKRKRYLRVLVVVIKPLSEVELALLVNIDDIEEVRTDVEFLASSNLLRRHADDWKGSRSQKWALTDFAQKFVSTFDKNKAAKLQLKAKYKQIREDRNQSREQAAINQFNNRVVNATTTDEYVAGHILQDALECRWRNDFVAALEHVEKAKALLPEFYEVWRISAQIKSAAGEASSAQDDFEQAIQLAEGKSQPLLVQYAEFLIGQGDYDTAAEAIEEAALQASASPQLIAKLAWIESMTHRLPRALELFAQAQQKLNQSNSQSIMGEMSGRERRTFLTQYIETLRKAADDQRGRDFPEEAFKFIIRGLELVEVACNENLIDDRLEQSGQVCFDRACHIMADGGLCHLWTQLCPLATRLSTHFLLRGNLSRGYYAFRGRCPEIFQDEDFQRIAPMVTEHLPSQEDGTLLRGSIRNLQGLKGFGFIMGDDGVSYFFHKSKTRRGEWDKIVGTQIGRVLFRIGPVEERGPTAVDVSLAEFDEVEGDD